MNYTAFDTETTGFRKYEGDQIFAYSICGWDGKTNVFRIPWTPNSLDFQRHDNFLRLQDYWNDTSTAKIMHNAKFDYSFCLANGISIPSDSEIHCTLVMSQLLQNLCNDHSLDGLAEMIYKYRAPVDDEVKKITQKLQRENRKKNPGARIGLSCYQFVDEEMMTRYQTADGERGMLLYKCFAPKLFAQPKMWEDYLNEIELIKATVEEERHGIIVDIRQSEKLKSFLSSELSQASKQAHEILGYDLNFNSSKQVATLLTKDLGLEITNTTTTGEASASKDSLIPLRDKHPIVDLILKSRAYSKGITAIESYLELMDPRDNTIHANIKTNHAVTGRQSCSEPNLQNVSKEVSMKTVYAIPARRCFRTSPNHVLFLPDYAGIELRLIVSISDEQEFITAMNEGKDVHDMASSCLYDDHWDEVEYLIKNPDSKLPEWIKQPITKIIAADEARGNHKRAWNDPGIFKQIRKTMRDGTKQYEFGIAYGGGYYAITHDLLGLDDNLKREGHARFEKRWPKIAFFTPNIVDQVRTNGFVTTAFGRKLYVRRSAAYQGSNYIVQGTAAGILKRGQVRVNQYCKHEFDNAIAQEVPIHDELIIDYPRHLLPYKDWLCSDIAFMLCYQPEIKVPLEVEWKMTTSNWAMAKKIDIKTPEGWSFARTTLLPRIN